MIRRILVLLSAVTLLATAACDNILGSRGAGAGTLSFHFDGEDSGRFSARGTRPHDWATRTHASGLRLEWAPQVQVFGYSMRSQALADQFFLMGLVDGAGTHPIADDHTPGTFYGEFAIEAAHAQNTARVIYVLTSGTVTLEEERGDRIRGSFQGEGRMLNGTGTIQISAGRFDVPNDLPRPVD